VVNTVNLSNHSGYGRYGGTKTTAAELDEMFESMEHNELLMPTRLLTGYTHSKDLFSPLTLSFL
jgi:pyridoxine kinase